MPSRKSQLFLILGLILTVAVLHFLGFYLQLYWRIPWYDRVVHTLGGLWIVLATFFILELAHVAFATPFAFMVMGILASVCVGTLWEVFELKAGITMLASHGYALDTAGDIISDVVGGLLGVLYVIKRWNILSWNLKK